MQARAALTGLSIALLLFLGSSAASATTFSNLGLDLGWACGDPPSATCFGEKDFDVVPTGNATGDITFTPTTAPLGTVDITLVVSSVTMTGGFDNVGAIVFSATYSVTDWSAFEDGTGVVQGLGSATGSVAGTYQQYDGTDPETDVLVASGPVNETPLFSNLVCGLTQCGFTVGEFGNFTLSVGTNTPTIHQFSHTFNTVVPEPSTGAMLGLGLLAFARAARRPRR